jgi:hypothetical protein
MARMPGHCSKRLGIRAQTSNVRCAPSVFLLLSATMDIVPKDLRHLRACLVCSLVKVWFDMVGSQKDSRMYICV